MAVVIGIKKVDYVNKKDERVMGVELHCQRIVEDIEGVEVSKYFVPYNRFPDFCNNVSLGCNVMASLNRWGQVDDIALL